MDLVFATGQVDPPDQLTAWRELVNRAFLPLAITPLGRPDRSGEFDASVTCRNLGGLRVWLVQASPMSAVRARPHIEASGGDDYLLALHVRGTAHGVQDGREVTLGPGDIALFDSGRPYSVSFTGPGVFQHVIYQVPRASLDARGDIGAATARRVAAASPAGRLVSPYLRTLAWPALSGPGVPPREPLGESREEFLGESLGEPPGESLGEQPGESLGEQPGEPLGEQPGEPLGGGFVDAGLDLAVSALRTAAGLAGRADPPHRSAARELRDYALAHLGDPGLSPEAVALACYVSVRQVHRLFAREGLTFGGWVREQRLRRCRDDLADPGLGHLAVAEIAARWGFRSAAHFTRAFQARYGVTPTGHRALRLP